LEKAPFGYSSGAARKATAANQLQQLRHLHQRLRRQSRLLTVVRTINERRYHVLLEPGALQHHPEVLLPAKYDGQKISDLTLY
jgi:hypothetical protein